LCLAKNDHGRRNGTTFTRKPIQKVWFTRQNHFRLWPQFASKVFIELLKLLRVKSALSTAYHPQTDGTTERMNQEIEAYLSIYCTFHPDDWLLSIHLLEFAHNNWRHADRQKSPFELILGYSPITIPHSFENTKFPTIEEKMKQLIKDQEETLATHELARMCMTERQKSNFIPFKVGDEVWLDSQNLKTIYHKKMAPKCEGPLKITKVIRPVTYQLVKTKRVTENGVGRNCGAGTEGRNRDGSFAGQGLGFSLCAAPSLQNRVSLFGKRKTEVVRGETG
jgi:hypothetical protein